MTRDLATRIEAVYRRHTGAATGHGAQAWFARRAYSHPTTVFRWIRAGHLPGPALGLLEALEQAGEEAHPDLPRRERR